MWTWLSMSERVKNDRNHLWLLSFAFRSRQLSGIIRFWLLFRGLVWVVCASFIVFKFIAWQTMETKRYTILRCQNRQSVSFGLHHNIAVAIDAAGWLCNALQECECCSWTNSVALVCECLNCRSIRHSALSLRFDGTALSFRHIIFYVCLLSSEWFFFLPLSSSFSISKTVFACAVRRLS